MKRSAIAILATSFMTLLSCSEEKSGYSINGKVSGFPDSTMVYLKNMSTDSNFDSTMVLQGKLAFNGHLEDAPETVWFHSNIDGQFVYTNLFMGNDNISMEADIKDFPWNVKVTGSLFHEDFKAMQGLTKELDIERDTMVRNYFSLSNELREEKQEILTNKMRRIDSTTKAIRLNYIRNHPNSYSSIIHLGFLKNGLHKDTVQKLYDNLTPKIKQSKYASIVSTFLKEKISKIGDKHHNFTAQDQNDNSIEFSKLVDRYVLLDFTTAYCGPCIQSVEELQKINRTYSDSLTIVSFSGDVKKETWLKSLERDSVQWTSLWDGKGRFSETSIKYGVNGFPTFFLLAPDGKIVDKWVGYGKGALEKRLEKYSLKNKMQ